MKETNGMSNYNDPYELVEVRPDGTPIFRLRDTKEQTKDRQQANLETHFPGYRARMNSEE